MSWNVTAVAHSLGLSTSAASRVVLRAARLGLVDRTCDDLDRRETWLSITTRGRAVIHRLDASLRDAARDVKCDDAVAEWLAKRCGPAG
jgi:DNA-binding MarR family transcriptional regulator